MKRLFPILCATILSYACAYAQVDTEFWFACPDLSESHFDYCIRLCVTTFDEAATVTISQPANPSFTTITQQVSANSYANINLRDLKAQVETTPGAVRKTGLLIQSTSKITVYYANYCDNSEIYSLKGRNALGTDFILPAQYTYDNSDTYGGVCNFEFVATEDGTEVTVTPTKACVGFPAGVPFTINLNRGEAYEVRSKGMTGVSHPSNTRIRSNRPIAVNYTDDGVAGPGADLIGDQLVPTHLAGTQYVAINYMHATEEVYIFPVSDDSTHIYANGTEIAYIAGAADPMKAGRCKFILPAGASFITADHPVQILQITSNVDSHPELGSAIIPPIVCTGSDEIAYKYTQTSGAAISIVTKTEYTDAFTVNGQAYLMPQEYFSPVPGAPEWSYTFKPAPVADILRVKNSKGIFHMGVIDNPGTTCSLGYFSNFNSVPLGVGSDKSYYLEGGDLHLSIQNASQFTNIQWHGPNGFYSTDAEPVIEKITEKDAGVYVVTADHLEGCDTPADTLRVSIFRPRSHELSVCYGNVDSIEAPGLAPYEWMPSTLPNERKVAINTTQDGMYVVTSQQMGVNMLYSTQKDVASCNPGSTVYKSLIRDIPTSNRYAFSAMFISEEGAQQPTLSVKINGQIIGGPIEATPAGTSMMAEWINVTEAAEVLISATSSSSAGAPLHIKDITLAPIYAVADTFHVTVRDSLRPVISGDEYICSGKASLTAETDYDTYLWSNGQTTKNATFTEAGDVWLRATKDDCSGTGYFTVKDPAETAIKLDSLPGICEGDAAVTLKYEILSGTIEAYDLLFDSVAHSVGFNDRVGLYPSAGELQIDLPIGLKPNIYHARLSFIEPICQERAELKFDIPVRYAAMITQRWNDVIGVRNSDVNGGYSFSGYQWYRNGSPIEGATGSWYYLGGAEFDTTDVYNVLLTREDGTSLFSCDYSPINDPAAKSEIKLSQNIVQPAGMIIVRNMPEQTKATIYNLHGQSVISALLDAGDASMCAPQEVGMYLLRVCGTDKDYVFKIIVQ